MEQALNDWYNENIRRCRIGKVSWKPPRHWRESELLKGQPIYPSYPLINDFWRLPQLPAITTPNTAQPPAWWQNPVVSTC